MNVEAEVVGTEPGPDGPDTRHLVHLAGVQMAMTADRAANLAKAESLVGEASARGARLVVLPELFGSVYFPQYPADPSYFDLAEPVPGPTSDALGAMAGRFGVTLIGSVYERVFAGLLYNTALVFGPDGALTGRSRKTHIPDGPGYSEKYYFTPGDSDYPVFGLGLGNRGVTAAVPTCWDQWFPEVARIAALKGAEVIVYPTAIGSEPAFPGVDTSDAWRTVLRGHAVANALFVVAVNRVGTEGELAFYGGSFVADPMGRVVAGLGREEGLLEADIDLAMVDRIRALSPFFRDRRPETYGALMTRGVGRR